MVYESCCATRCSGVSLYSSLTRDAHDAPIHRPQRRSFLLLPRSVIPDDPHKFAAKYGMRLCDVHEYETRNGVVGVVRKYENQREGARERKIEWLFDLKSWLEVWDGKISKRGRGLRALCMCRHKDLGPYAPWNVRIATGYENKLDWWEKKPKWFKWQGSTGMSKAAKKEFDGDPKAEALFEISTRFGAK